MLGTLLRLSRQLVLRTQADRLRPLWALCYGLVLKLVVLLLRLGTRGVSVYLGGSLAEGEAVYGVTDIDLLLVVPGRGSDADRGRRRLARRAERMRGCLPGPLRGLLELPQIHDRQSFEELERRPSFAPSSDQGAAVAPGVYFGNAATPDRLRRDELPSLYGPGQDLRLIAGHEARVAQGCWESELRPAIAWRNLQFVWQQAFELCREPDGVTASYASSKLIAQAVRIWLWLERGYRAVNRGDALRHGLELMPEEASAIEAAIAGGRASPQGTSADLGLTMQALMRISARIAALLKAAAKAAGHQPVELREASGGELALPMGGWNGGPASSAPRPLLDWRAMVWPRWPDETFVCLPGDPSERGLLATCSRATHGPWPTLARDGMLIRPTGSWYRGRLRTVHCELSDPASFALISGAKVADFALLPGFSARDVATSAVAERGAWLRALPRPLEPSGELLGGLGASARAALLSESIRERNPILPTSTYATFELLAERAGHPALAEAAVEEYRSFAEDWATPSRAVVDGLDRLIGGMSAFSS